MEPFSITCSTCKSRLKVRSAAAIGQVVSCPKCGGMVLVKAPDDSVPPEVANAATKPVEQQGEKAKEHNTKDFDDIESILSGAAPVPVAAVSRGEQPRGADKAAAPAQVAPVPDPAAAPPAPPPAKATLASVPPIAAPTHRYGIWLALSVLMGVALAAAVVIAGSLLRSRDTAVAKSSTPGITPTKSAESQPNVAPTNDVSTDAKTEAPPADAAKTDTSPQATEPPAAPKVKVKEKQDDPLGLVEPAKAAGKSGKPPVAIGDDPLGKFGKVLEVGNDNPLPAAEAPAATEKSVDEEPAADGPPAAPRPAPRHVDVAARLADSLAGIDVPGVPLADFLTDLSSLSTIPITLDPEGLPLAGLSPASPVSLKAENTTIGQALTLALAPLHLEYTIADDQLVVSLGGKLADRSFPVDDLTNKNEEQAQQLAQWATALIEPGTWKDGDEEGASLTLGVEQFAVRASDRTYAGLLLLMEKLRVARGLALRTRQPAEVFRLESRSARASTKLATTLSLNYSQPTLLAIILKRLEKEGQFRILVDWRALAAEGWNADGEGILSVENKPLSEALTELLAPMDLAWRAVDEQTVQVTTLSALAQSLELEVYPVGTLAANAAAGEVLLARLRTALPSTGTEDAAGALHFDPVSGCILASLPQPQQRVVEKLLGEWASAPK
ncbi:MAG TPA: hypothetical protein VMP01_16525 [Pirellulaceae bacterium]|nr:hypothetical protein [Pirellulaceae bacterium]